MTTPSETTEHVPSAEIASETPDSTVDNIREEQHYKIITMADGDKVQVDSRGRTVEPFTHPRNNTPAHPRVIGEDGDGKFLWN